ncbi:hypothetical protein QVD17_28220 [Tagetes erecta]|uniref:SHSP domain-containing protein n=1 Tax=Tagetes erecta TaxID=13708 RepID=A0AAD8KCE8_TARER|nr:hypothetical protein QVD17_28220 [Tagetes erecta]
MAFLNRAVNASTALLLNKKLLFSAPSPSLSFNRCVSYIFDRCDDKYFSEAKSDWGMKENNESLNLRFDMPGLDKDDVKIIVEKNDLIIIGQSEGNESEEDEPRSYSSKFILGENHGYKLKEIKGEMKNGVLKVVVPKEKKDVWEVEVK